MKEAGSCGVLIMRREPETSFLLMRHADRWVLPKGHVDSGESDLQCALRELNEETGIMESDIELDPQFQFLTRYEIRDPKDKGRTISKSLRIFLGWLKREVEIKPSEHLGFEWFKWNPPHRIQNFTIDPLLAALADHLANVAK